MLLRVERTKARPRAKVEHSFHVIKNLFGYRKVRCKGLAKNQVQLSFCFPWPIWCWGEDARAMLTGPLCLDFGLAAGKPGCQVK